MRARAMAAILLLGFLGAAQEKKKCEVCNGTEVVECSTCKGKWQKVKQVVTCKRQGAQGCDGAGYRACLTCAGAGTLPCGNCGASGKIRVKVGEKRGNKMVAPIYDNRDCPQCSGGKTDCDKCRPMGFCSLCNHYFNEGQRTCPECQKGRVLEFKKGISMCPRCKGTGQYEKTGKCEDCTKGKRACPSCVSVANP
jgi:hypothetical protein